jgi:hypothetical protein
VAFLVLGFAWDSFHVVEKFSTLSVANYEGNQLNGYTETFLVVIVSSQF